MIKTIFRAFHGSLTIKSDISIAIPWFFGNHSLSNKNKMIIPTMIMTSSFVSLVIDYLGPIESDFYMVKSNILYQDISKQVQKA